MRKKYYLREDSTNAKNNHIKAYVADVVIFICKIMYSRLADLFPADMESSNGNKSTTI